MPSANLPTIIGNPVYNSYSPVSLSLRSISVFRVSKSFDNTDIFFISSEIKSFSNNFFAFFANSEFSSALIF